MFDLESNLHNSARVHNSLNGEVAELVLMTLTVVIEKWLCEGALGINMYV